MTDPPRPRHALLIAATAAALLLAIAATAFLSRPRERGDSTAKHPDREPSESWRDAGGEAAPAGRETPATKPWADGVVVTPTPSGPRSAHGAAAGGVRFVSFAPDGRLLIVRGDGKVEIRHLVTDAVQPVHFRVANPRAAALSPGGGKLALAGSDRAAVWDIVAAHETRIGGDDVHALAFSPDGRSLAVAHAGGEVKAWDAIVWSVTATLRPNVGAARSISFRGDGRTIAFAGSGGAAVWDLLDRKGLTMLHPGDACPSAAFAPDGKALVVATPGGAVSWAPVFWQRQATFAGGQAATHVAHWPTRNGLLAVASADRAIRLFDPSTRATVATLNNMAGDIAALALSPDARTVAASGSHGVTIWDSTTLSSRPLR